MDFRSLPLQSYHSKPAQFSPQVTTLPGLPTCSDPLVPLLLRSVVRNLSGTRGTGTGFVEDSFSTEGVGAHVSGG